MKWLVQYDTWCLKIIEHGLLFLEEWCSLKQHDQVGDAASSKTVQGVC